MGGTETVQLLMDRGADIALKDVELRSPLHVAIGNSATMEVLMKVTAMKGSQRDLGLQGFVVKSIGLQVYTGSISSQCLVEPPPPRPLSRTSDPLPPGLDIMKL